MSTKTEFLLSLLVGQKHPGRSWSLLLVDVVLKLRGTAPHCVREIPDMERTGAFCGAVKNVLPNMWTAFFRNGACSSTALSVWTNFHDYKKPYKAVIV
eukprot:scaffold9027_cov107-Cylindrotheca_fusiformis.AAC.3